MNKLFKTECALLDKTWTNGLSQRWQPNCQATLTDNGYHIYRPPNLIYPDCGNTVWGGLRIMPFTMDSNFMIKGHTYIIRFEIDGQSSNAARIYWTYNMGWHDDSALAPRPSDVSYSIPGTNFNGHHSVFYKFTVNDDLIKTCSTSFSTFVAGQEYLSYRDFCYQFDYQSTGELGTDIYLTNFRMYDITDTNTVNVNKNGVVTSNSFSDMNDICSFGSELLANDIIEI